MTTEGVLKGGSLKRMVEEKRWTKDDFDRMMGTPWRMRPQRPEDLDAAVRVELPEVEPGMRLMPEIPGHEAIPRNLYVKRSDVEGHYTPGCEGCNAIQVGLPPRAHNSECRFGSILRLSHHCKSRYLLHRIRNLFNQQV